MIDAILMFIGIIISAFGMTFATFRYPPYNWYIKIAGIIMSLLGFVVSGYAIFTT